MFTKPLRGTQLNRSHPLARGLVGCWLFNEGVGNKAYDLSGYGNHGTLETMADPPTAASGWNPGRRGSALAFDGSSDYVDCGNDDSLNITEAITIEAWVKFNVLSVESQIVVKFGSAGFRLVKNDSKIHAFLWGWTIANEPTINTTLSTGIWYQVVFTYNGNIGKIYLNGSMEDSYTVAQSIPTSIRILSIGRNSGNDDVTGSNYLNGSMDSVKIYNRALSAEEIKWSYREQYAMFEPATEIGMLGVCRANPFVGSNVAAMEMLR